MADLPEWRVRLVEKYMAQLSSDDPTKRRDAARWLGEAIEDPAIPRLIEVYHNDPDRRVRKAAEYALGQFKAFNYVLQEDEDFAQDVIEDVILKGQLGRPAATGGLRATLIGFTLSLIALTAIYFAAPAGVLASVFDSIDLSALTSGRDVAEATIAPTLVADASAATGFVAQPDPSDPRRAALLNDLRGTFTRVRDDVGNLARQFQGGLAGTPLDCSAFFNNAPPYEISPENAERYPDIANVVARLEQAQADFGAAFTRFTAACFGGEPLTAEAIGPVFALLRPAVEAVTAIDTDFNAMEGVSLPTAAPTTAGLSGSLTGGAGTSAPEPTVGPTPTATPDASLALRVLFTIIDDMTNSRGAASLLVTYWNDVIQVGQTDGCNLPTPPIPNNVELDPALADNELLTQSVTLVNQGLETVRVGWQAFALACGSGNRNQLVQQAGDQRALAQAGRASFEAAGEILVQLR